MSRVLSCKTLQGSEYYLAPYISLCALDDGLIALDQRHRRYLSLPGKCVAALAAACAEWQVPHTDTQVAPSPQEISATLNALVGMGILTNDGETGVIIRTLRIAVSESIDFGWGSQRDIPPDLKSLTCFSVALARASAHLHLKSFDQLVTYVRQRREQSSSGLSAQDSVAIRVLVNSFRRWRPLAYASRGACLFDSLVLLEFLAHFRVYPTWVLGVRSRPFMAHSWVQHEHCVLNGTVEYVEQFTPILIV